jgi:type VII secretion-associated serine protease mycosin
LIPLFTRCATGSNRSRTAVGTALVRGALAVALGASTVMFGAPAHADAVRDAQWHLKFMKVPEAHRITQGQGITVAVIDTGVDANHPDLKGNVLPGVDAWDTSSPDKGQKDVAGHGTGIASLIAGHGHGPGNSEGVLGIAPKAKILPINVMDPKHRTPHPDTIGDAIEYAAIKGADVICVAMSTSFSSRQEEAVDIARARGALVIAAADNRGPGSISVLGHPAGYVKTVAVSATDRNGNFSTVSIQADKMDIAAPGVDLTMARAGGGYWKATGTSGAAAVAAGAAALIRSKYPEPGSNLFLNRLVLNATDRGEPGLDEQYGWGVVDLMTSLTRMPPSLTPQPTASVDPPPPADAPDETLEVKNNWSDLVPIWLALQAIVGTVVALAVWVWRRLRRQPSAPPPPTSATQTPVPQPVPDHEWQRPPGAALPPPGPPQRRE